MRILLTGSSGMLGSAILRRARNTDFQFIAPSRSQLNLLSETNVLDFIKIQKPDAIIHCAARVGGISANMAHPLEFLDENIRIDSAILNAAAECDVKNFLYMGSSCVYPRDRDEAMQESEILQGPLEPTNEGYALAKLVGMKKVQYMSQNRAWRSLILSNLYGPRDQFDPNRSHLIAAIIQKAFHVKENNLSYIEMWGDGTVRREFTFIDDVADFVINSMHRLINFHQVMNIGAGEDNMVIDYYRLVLKALDIDCEIRPLLEKPSGMKRKLLDVTKARNFGWSPKVGLEEGIKKTVDWYQRFGNNRETL